MNYSIHMLRQAVCLCLGFISMAAWAADNNDDLVKKACSCDLSVSDFKNFNYNDKNPRDFYWAIRLMCEDDLDSDGAMRKALVKKFLVFDYQPKLPDNNSDTYGAEQRGSYDDLLRHPYARITWVYSSAIDECANEGRQKREHQRIAREMLARQELEEKQRVKQEAEKQYQSQLKSGAVPVSNFQDAVLLHAPTASLTDLMASPLLKPDRGIYSGMVRLDAQDGDNLLRAKIDTSLLFGGRFGGGIYYAHLRLTKKTVNFSPRNMRIGGAVNVLGRYVQNRKYTTIAGEEKTMPVFEVMYIGG